MGSINLSEFVKNPFTPTAYFDFPDFEKATKVMVRYLDTIIDLNMENHALPEQKQMVHDYRNIGLGLMGLHDCLIKMRMEYGSESSLNFVEKIMYKMFKDAFTESVELAKEKGSFPNYTTNVLDSTIVKKHFTEEELSKIGATTYGVRNCSLLSIAPTGSIGSMLNVSTGCEPIYAMSYMRKTESLNNNTDKYYKVHAGIAKEYFKKFHTKDYPEYFVESKNINWKNRIKMQATLQEHVDTAISSTINLPNDITLEGTEQVYLYAWEKGLKGLTIYRDGSEKEGILSTSDSKSKKKDGNNILEIPRGFVIKVDNNTVGKERHLNTGCGTLHFSNFFDPDSGELLEDYINKGSQGGCFSNLIAISRLISLAARAGVDAREISDQLLSVPACPSYVARTATKHDTSKGACCPNAIGYALLDMCKEMLEEIATDEELENADKTNNKTSNEIPISNEEYQTRCPECGEPLNGASFLAGCVECKNCGWNGCE